MDEDDTFSGVSLIWIRSEDFRCVHSIYIFLLDESNILFNKNVVSVRLTMSVVQNIHASKVSLVQISPFPKIHPWFCLDRSVLYQGLSS